MARRVWRIRSDTPDGGTDAREARAHSGRDAVPAGLVPLDWGSAWLDAGRRLLEVVPSIVVPEEDNVLINPAYPAAAALGVMKQRPWRHDLRLA